MKMKPCFICTNNTQYLEENNHIIEFTKFTAK